MCINYDIIHQLIKNPLQPSGRYDFIKKLSRRGTVMKSKKEIKLCLDLQNSRDKNIYQAIKDFGENHDISNELEALKEFMLYLHFLGADIVALNEKIKGLS